MVWDSVIIGAIIGASAGVVGVLGGSWLTYCFAIKNFKINLITETTFKLYNDLWIAFVNLKDSGDKLWKNATSDNLFNFKTNLDKTSNKLEESRLLLNNKDYTDIKDIIQIMKNYQFGKQMVIGDIRVKGDIKEYDNIQHIIDNNKENKIKYEEKIEFFRNKFSQIK